MKFLKALLWVVIVALVLGMAARNWRDVTLTLWGDLQADIKIPVLLLIMFVLGFLPAWLTQRARYWRLARRNSVTQVPAPTADQAREGAAA